MLKVLAMFELLSQCSRAERSLTAMRWPAEQNATKRQVHMPVLRALWLARTRETVKKMRRA
jgi:hypothetical protein